MTREEAITALGDRNNLLWGMSKEEQKYYSEALNMAIEALEQEPCEDAISFPKGALKKRGKGYVVYNPEWLKENWQTELKVMGIEPSVQPKPKIGHWIMSDDGLYRPICNNCGAHPWKGYIPTVEEATEVFKYCPNCGAKMAESEE